MRAYLHKTLKFPLKSGQIENLEPSLDSIAEIHKLGSQNFS